MSFMRDQTQMFREELVDQKQYLEDSMANFDKQLNDYRSQVLWRIKDCEELLKSRVTKQELNDQISAIKVQVQAKQELDYNQLTERLQNSYDKCSTRIKTAENYIQDKLDETKEYMHQVQKDAASMATQDQIQKLHENEKTIKSNFQLEFERFQQYLKDQNTRFSKMDSKNRELEKRLNAFNALGGIEELSKFMKEYQDEKASQYVPKADAKVSSNRGKNNSNLNQTVTSQKMENAIATFNSQMNNLSGVDSKTIKFMQDMLNDHENRIE